MSLAAESPSHSLSSSSGSDDFAAFLDAELELASADSSAAAAGDDAGYGDSKADADDANQGEDEEDKEDAEILEQSRLKRCRVEDFHTSEQLDGATTVERDQNGIGTSKEVPKKCPPHPAFFGGLCVNCGKLEGDDGSGVGFGYIHKDLRLGTSEVDRLRQADLKNLLREKKLILILDLDHTLINSTSALDLSDAEKYLEKQIDASRDDSNRSLYRMQSLGMLTKLRPFVRTFLREASRLFDMYIYTMGERAYALEIARLLDPGNVYFNSKVISQSDCTTRHQKGLDVVLGAETFVVILDDTESVWQKHKENLILMERYFFFASGCRHFYFNIKSLAESMKDERESDGALATILDVLRHIHQMFFDPVLEIELSSRDVRQVIKKVRQEVLHGCKIVFSRVFPSKACAEDQSIWKMAERLGAVCCTEADSSVTHVVAMDPGTEKARWALQNDKFLVNPRWIEAANFLWRRQKEEEFTVTNQKEQKNDVSLSKHR